MRASSNPYGVYTKRLGKGSSKWGAGVKGEGIYVTLGDKEKIEEIARKVVDYFDRSFKPGRDTGPFSETEVEEIVGIHADARCMLREGKVDL